MADTAGGTLAQWIVEITQKGAEAMERALEDIKGKMTDADQVASKLKTTQDAMGKAAQDAGKKIQTSQVILAAGYGLLTAKLMGFIRAGMEGTAEGNRLAFMFQRINREVASIFTPVIHEALRGVESLLMWFRNLSGQGQATIRTISLVTVAFLGAATVLPTLVTGIKMLGGALAVLAANPIGAVLALTGAFVGLLLSTQRGRDALGKFFESFKPAINLMVEGFAKALTNAVSIGEALMKVVGVVTELVGKFDPLVGLLDKMGGPLKVLQTVMDAFNPITGITNALRGLGLIGPERRRQREELTPAGGGFEGFQATFQRIQENILKNDIAQRVREQSLEELRGIRANTQRPAFGNQNPAVAA